MTLLEVIYSVKERLQINTDDRSFDVTDEFILFTYEGKRAIVLSRMYNSAKAVNQAIVQHYKVEMEKVDRSICPIVPVGCTILRSKEPLPALLYLHRGIFISRVGSLDIASKGYTMIEYDRVPFAFSGVINAKKPIFAFVTGNYLYIFSKNKVVNLFDNVAISGVFEQPSKIMLSSNCASNCNSYPMSLDYHEMVIEIVVKDLTIKYQIPTDIENDSSDNMTISDGRKGS